MSVYTNRLRRTVGSVFFGQALRRLEPDGGSMIAMIPFALTAISHAPRTLLRQLKVVGWSTITL